MVGEEGETGISIGSMRRVAPAYIHRLDQRRRIVTIFGVGAEQSDKDTGAAEERSGILRDIVQRQAGVVM